MLISLLHFRQHVELSEITKIHIIKNKEEEEEEEKS